MTRVLLVSNGHGEAAIADRIALELQALEPAVACEHVALVGAPVSHAMRDVGPRRAMPSGGLIAMGNVPNLVRDVRHGLLGLWFAQRAYLRERRGSVDVAVAVGDAYALAMTLTVRAPTVFVGTAKSVNVAPYGPMEERLLRRARAVFVRDDATAQRLRDHRIGAQAANAIVDLFDAGDDPQAQAAFDGFDPALALFPGSRESAYGDAAFLLEVLRGVAARKPGAGGVLSVAPGLDPRRFAQVAATHAFEVAPGDGDGASGAIPFALSAGGRVVARAWRGGLGPLLRRATLVLGQAGTANEAAAAAGLPVVAFGRPGRGREAWYRRRQRGLLGDALLVVPEALDEAVAGVLALLDDPARRAAMGRTGAERMGPPGGSARIAQRILACAR